MVQKKQTPAAKGEGKVVLPCLNMTTQADGVKRQTSVQNGQKLKMAAIRELAAMENEYGPKWMRLMSCYG